LLLTSLGFIVTVLLACFDTTTGARALSIKDITTRETVSSINEKAKSFLKELLNKFLLNKYFQNVYLLKTNLKPDNILLYIILLNIIFTLSFSPGTQQFIQNVKSPTNKEKTPVCNRKKCVI